MFQFLGALFGSVLYFFANLLSTENFNPRWGCGAAWKEEPAVGWLHISADLATFLAYFAVPTVVVFYVMRHGKMRLPAIFYVLLGLIFFSCGTVHLVEACIFIWPVYRLSGFLKLITAVVSCLGVIVLMRILPAALDLKTGEAYEREHAGRQQAEEQLSLERNLLHAMMYHLPDVMVYVKDKSGRCLRVSKTLADKLQLNDPEEIIGSVETDFFDQSHAERIQSEDVSVINTGKPILGKVQYEEFPDGSQAWVSITKVPMHDAQEQLSGMFGIARDITKVIDAEKSIRASEERYQLCITGSNDGMWDWNTQTNEVYYAPRFKELLGFAPDEFAHRLDAWRERLHPDDLEPTFAAINRHLTQREAYDVEYRMLTKTHDYRWFRARGQAIWGENGEPTRMAGSITDIHKRKQAEAKLESVADKLALPGEQPFSTANTTSATRFRLSQFALRDMIECGKQIRSLRQNHDKLPQFSAALVRYLRESIVDDDKQPAFALARVYETQQFDQLDDELREFVARQAGGTPVPSKTNYLHLLASSGSQLAWNNPVTSTRHRLVPTPSIEAVRKMPIVNQLVEELQIKTERSAGKRNSPNLGTRAGVFHIADAVNSPYIPDQESFVERHGIKSAIGFGGALPSGRLFVVILFSRVPLTHETALLFSHLSLSTQLAILPYETAESRAELQILAVDRLLRNYEEVVCSTETKLNIAMTDLRRARDSAESANRAKTNFLANMSHEIRTPMNGIIGMADVLANTSLTEEQHEYLEIVRHSADSLLHLLNDILDVSRIEAGRLKLESIVFELRELVGKAMQTVNTKAAEKELALTCRFSSDLPNTLIGDPSRLRQILVNLVGNAVKFTERGEVTIEVTEETRNKDMIRVRFAVEDTGIGIPADKQALIFDTFRQADDSTTRKYGGSGLGLAISSQLAKMMNGDLRVESSPGAGTTFYFTAEFGLSPHSTERDRELLVNLRNAPVLVVDDDVANRHSLEKLLSSWHMRPYSVDSGPKALVELIRAVETEPYQVVLLKDLMPDMNGFELAEKIQQDSRLRNVALIMLSSAKNNEDQELSYRVGIHRYLTKPFIQSELLDAIMFVRAEPNIDDTTTSRPAGVAPMRVLLVEDGVINQHVAKGLLNLHDHLVTLATNGREALDAWEKSGSFDVILMDVQMPEMDGIEATRAIRDRERESGQHTPIIAMTAGAMKGDRERCLDAGMDDYLAKPIDSNSLFEVLYRVQPRDRQHAFSATNPPHSDVSPAANPADAEQPPSGEEAVIDLSVAEERIPGGREGFQEMVGLFTVECDRLCTAIAAAIQDGDAAALQLNAHTLKGAATIFGAEFLVEAALTLELRGKAKNMADLEPLMTRLRQESQRVLQALQAACD